MHDTAPQLPSWFRGVRDLPREHGFEALRVEGVLPPELRGTLYRNGPSLFSSHGEAYGHWFDGDGAVSAVRFDGGSASGAVRVVEGKALREERKAGRRIHGGWGTRPAGGPLARMRPRFKNPANISVMGWNDRLFALFEAGLPTEIDPDTLLTIGETDLDGLVPMAFSAHPHRVPSRKATYNFGVRFGRVTMLDLFELRDDGGSRRLASLPLPGPTEIHDFIATDRYLLFLVPPVRLRVFRFLLGIGAVSDNMQWKPELGTEVLVVPIDDPEKPIRFQAEPFFSWHFANAYEEGDGIVVDLVRHPDFETERWLGDVVHGGTGRVAHGKYHRARIDLRGRKLVSEELWETACEFPRISPKKIADRHRHVWMAAHQNDETGLWDAVAHLDTETGRIRVASTGPDQYPSEPVFVPRPGATEEDDGWVLSLVYDAVVDRSHVAVLDGRELAPIARAWFDHHVPFTFHGGFAPLR